MELEGEWKEREDRAADEAVVVMVLALTRLKGEERLRYDADG